MGKKKIKKRLTIERQLERYYEKEKHAERNAVLWHAWCQNKRWFSQLLETTLGSFPSYSRHDESHAQTVLHNIELILGEDRIRELSASDCFMLLHTVYIHDIGMVITYSDRKEIVQNDHFLEMVDELAEDNDFVFKKAVRVLKQTEYDYDNVDGKDEKQKRLYKDKLDVYYAILHLIANYRRSEHGNISEQRLKDWTLESEKLGTGFSMAGIPQRIFILNAQCAGLHTDSEFDHIIELPQEDDGYVSDYLHPRFIAVLLQLGDILDMDNDRFHPLTKECLGDLPEISERHFQKHQSIRKLYIRPDIISIEADCSSQDALRLVRKECDMLKDILKNASYNWMLICPPGFSGALPTVDSVTLYLNGIKIPEELVATQFCISQKKAFAILEGSNVYEERFVFLREFLQNTIDASKMQYWHESVRTWGSFVSPDKLREKSPEEFEKRLSTALFPIDIGMQIVMRDENQNESIVTEEEIKRLKAGGKPAWEYGVTVTIKDFGTGIDKESILNIAKVGNSRRKERFVIKEMPPWLTPTAEFGIGLQSAFIVTNLFKCRTYTRSNERYEITFSTVKSNFYEGYINVQPLEKEEAFGTCFEAFVPISKKLRHQLYPSAWDGKDYFDEDYEVLRPVRHAAELLAQMALYLDRQIGEQLFPVHLKVKKVKGVDIPLNISEKNQLKRLQYDAQGSLNDQNQVILKEMKESGVLGEELEGIEFLVQRQWEKDGTPWIYYNGNQDNDILDIQTGRAIALIDCKNGYFYFWDNQLCTFCTINMEKFLHLEKNELENADKECMNVHRNISIYYKGIILEEIEVPDLGNELIQSIDIKGKLAREYINLNRKGLTEMGRLYFKDEIYEKLLESIHDTLKKINRKHKEKLVDTICGSMEYKKKLVRRIDELLTEQDMLKPMLDLDKYARMNQTIAIQEMKKDMDRLRQEILMQIKQQLISTTMLAFLAKKDIFDPVMERNCMDETGKEECYWQKVVERSREYGKWIQERESVKSILFHIQSYDDINLLGREINMGKREITFVDIFSEKQQFMIVSKRRSNSAPWEQFLVSIHSEEINARSPIDVLKRHLVTDNRSEEKRVIDDEIKEIEKNALWNASIYGMNEVGRKNLPINSQEYRQQYILKWLLKYIPTVALFMNETGNTRINIIHGQSFPIIYVNDNYKMFTAQRIIEDTQKYRIERFSIPTWQELQTLRCESLPYAHFFVKRGYLSKDSYGKVIFPFGRTELMEIEKRIKLGETKEIIVKLKKLNTLLNATDYIFEALLQDDKSTEAYIQELDSDNASTYWEVYLDRKKRYGLDFEKYSVTRANRWEISDKIREEYVSLIKYICKIEKENLEERRFVLDDLDKYKEEWEKLYIYLVLKVLDVLEGEMWIRLIHGKMKDACDNLILAWKYMLNREYLKEKSEIAKYKSDYMSLLEQENSTQRKRQVKILKYISRYSSRHYSVQQLWKCWRAYINEMFDVFSKIEFKEIYRSEWLLEDQDEIRGFIDR